MGIKLYRGSLRLFSLPLSILPALAATAAVLPISRWAMDILAVEVLGIALLHIIGNLLNDYFDYEAGVDHRVERDEGRPGRLLVKGEITPQEIRFEILTALLLLIPAVFYLVWRTDEPVLIVFGGIALLAGWSYTGPPLRLKYHALGEITIFLLFGPLLMVGSAWAQTGRFEPCVLLLSTPFGMATTAVLVGNNLRDVEEDRAAGITTLPHLIGIRTTRYFYVLLTALPPLMITFLPLFRETSLLILGAPLLVLPARSMIRSVLKGERIPDIDARTAKQASLLFLSTLSVLIFSN